MGAQMVKEVASKTADKAGDGTTTATVLAEAIYQRRSSQRHCRRQPDGNQTRHRKSRQRDRCRAEENQQADPRQKRDRPSRDHFCQRRHRNRRNHRQSDGASRQRRHDHCRRRQRLRNDSRRRRRDEFRPRLPLCLLHDQCRNARMRSSKMPTSSSTRKRSPR